MGLSFTKIDLPLEKWGEILNNSPDRTIFQTPEWLSFVARNHGAEPVLAVLRDHHHVFGYFTGLVVKKFGLKILGSPLPGWTTSYMGLNLLADKPRPPAIQALIRFAFDDLNCVHLELMDRHLTELDARKLGLRYRILSGFEIDLTHTEQDLLDRMSGSCRRCIRKAQKIGVTVEEADDLGFADVYYSQLKEVFRKQHLVPSYGVNRVRDLIAYVHGTGRLLLLRARDQNGNCIATGIFPAMNGTMYFWGGASLLNGRQYRPNEAIHWYAMRYWKARGMQRYDMGGKGDYKRKFGGYEIGVPWVRISKYVGIPLLRELMRSAVRFRQSILGLVGREISPTDMKTRPS